MSRDYNLDHAKNGFAILAVCIVESINDADPTYKERFLERLGEAYDKIKNDSEGDVTQEFEVLTWVSNHLTGYSKITGQGQPFLRQND